MFTAQNTKVSCNFLVWKFRGNAKITAPKMKFSIKDFFSKCDQIRTGDLVTITEKFLDGKLYFLCTVPILR